MHAPALEFFEQIKWFQRNKFCDNYEQINHGNNPTVK